MKPTKRANTHDTFNRLFRDMNRYYASLNEHSIWLFIASLGCWSIPANVGWLQKAGISIVLVLFAYKLRPLLRGVDNTPYRKRYAKLKAEAIASYGAGFERKAYRKKYLHTYFKAWVFWVCFIFAFVSWTTMVFHVFA